MTRRRRPRTQPSRNGWLEGLQTCAAVVPGFVLAERSIHSKLTRKRSTWPSVMRGLILTGSPTGRLRSLRWGGSCGWRSPRWSANAPDAAEKIL
jgi:hypothetical protein